MKKYLLSAWIVLLGLIPGATVAAPLGTAFNYNAHVSDQQGPVNGTHDVQFTLFTDALATPPAAYGPITILNLQIKNGVLGASPDFGAGVFDGTLYWMAVNIRKQASDPWEALGTPQPISAAPYAQHAPTSGKAKSVENGAVHAAGLQAKAVGRDKLDDKAVGQDQLDEDSISELKMKDAAVSEGKLKDAAVSEGKLKDDAISEGKLKNGAVSRGKLAMGAVGKDQLDTDAVEADKIKNDAVTGNKIASGHVVKSLNGLRDGVTLAAGSGVTITPAGNTLTVASLPDPNAWSLNGNAGAATDFLGTTDATPLTIQVNNTVAMRYLPVSGTATPNLVGGWVGNSIGLANPGGVTISGGGQDPATLGDANLATDNYTTVGGGSGNLAGSDDSDPANAPFATVGGGLANQATADSATVAGGRENHAEGPKSVVGGGSGNQARGTESTVGGGFGNATELGGQAATIGGGRMNIIRSPAEDGTIGGGGGNEVLASGATIGGGSFNTTGLNGLDATIPGGRNNFVDGLTCFAAGYRAKAVHDGAFVWADKRESDFESSNENEFSARAIGGVRFVSGYVGGGGTIAVGVQLSPGAGSWSSLSDRNTKTNIQPVEARSILEQVVRLPIATWNYKSQNASIRHIGPMAQDFASAFNVGEGDTTITTVDADGVALAAIQGLDQKLNEKDAEIQELKRTVAELKDLVGQLASKQNGGAN